MGLLWAWHGVAFLASGAEAMTGVTAPAPPIRSAAAGYLLVSVALLSAAALAFALRRGAFLAGIGAAVAFVIDGFIANSVLFETSRWPHDLANVVLGTAVVICLIKGRSALAANPSSASPPAEASS